MVCSQQTSKLYRALLAVLIFASGACTYSVHQQYIGSMDPVAAYSKGRWVTAEATDFVILGFERQTTYVENAYKSLESKCSGRISQVTTEHLTSYKFLSYEQKVIMRGWCLS